MLDNISLEFKDKSNAEKWFNENKEKFAQYNKQEINFEDKSFSTYPIKADVENLKYKITDKRAYLEGSIHKYWNNIKYKQLVLEGANEEENLYLKDNNWNEFYLEEIITAIEQLKLFFDGLNLNEADITTLEFGFNLNVNKTPSHYIDYNFLMYEFKHPFYDDENFRIKKFRHNKFEFKVYNKKEQYSLQDNILRVEIVIHSLELQKLAISCIDDLQNPEVIEKINNFFYSRFQGFTIIDKRFHRKDIPLNVCNYIGNNFDSSYWKYLKRANNLNRIKRLFKNTLENYELLKTRTYIMATIKKKFEKLFHGVYD